ncbi:MAG: TerB family tellurite resistance protein [Pseudomonadota bacterium]
MIADILKMLRGEEPPKRMTAEDERVALAALLVRVAMADHQYDDSEKAAITAILAARYSLSDGDATALRAEGETLEHDAPDTVRFTRVLKDAVAYEDRAALAEGLWLVALADGERAAEENAFLRQVVALLGISDQDSGLARQRVERG